MLQGTDQRLIRAAGRFEWSYLRLQIAEQMLLQGGKLPQVAAALGTTYDNAKKELCVARKQLRQQAQDECEPEAWSREALEEDDPEGVYEKAKALRFAMDNIPETEECIAAVRIIDGHWKYSDGVTREPILAES